jgi:SAM-dependent methyltransferase
LITSSPVRLQAHSVYAIAAKPMRFGSNQDGNYDSLYNRSCTDHATQPYRTLRTFISPDSHILDVVQMSANPGEAVVELGCNAGNNLLPLAERGYRAYGVDLCKDALNTLKEDAKKLGIQDKTHVEQWDFAEAGSLPPKWDHLKGKVKALFAVHVLSHLSGSCLEKTMQGLQQYLAPGGVIIASIIAPSGAPRSQYHLNSGYAEHDDQTLNRAFKGLQKVMPFSRRFERGKDSLTWTLPFKRLHWVVYQK